MLRWFEQLNIHEMPVLSIVMSTGINLSTLPSLLIGASLVSCAHFHDNKTKLRDIRMGCHGGPRLASTNA